MASLTHSFTARAVDPAGEGIRTDDSVMWEVVTLGGERIGGSSTEIAAKLLAYALNLALTEWVERDPGDRTANAELTGRTTG